MRRHLRDGEYLDWTQPLHSPRACRLFLRGGEMIGTSVYRLARHGLWVYAWRYATGPSGVYYIKNADGGCSIPRERLRYRANDLQIEAIGSDGRALA